MKLERVCCVMILFINLVLNHAKKPCKFAPITIDDIHMAFYVSKEAYSEHSKEGRDIPYTDGLKITKVVNEYFPMSGSHLKVVVAEKTLTTVVAFRGTATWEDLLKQFEAYLKDSRSSVTFAGTKTLINTFFWEGFQLLLPGIKSKLKDQSRKYILTGHSLGGALASILAVFMSEDGGEMWENPSSSLITFGQPRVGNKAYALVHDNLVEPARKLRFINNLDPVPHIPPWPSYEHHSREIWMTKSVGSNALHWDVCKTLDPLSCSNLRTLIPSLKDHLLTKYGDQLFTEVKYFHDSRYEKHTKWLDALKRSCT